MPLQIFFLYLQCKQNELLSYNMIENTNIELEWAKEHSSDQGKYPDVFSNETGFDLVIPGHSEFYIKKRNERLIKIRISSFIGICAEAVHYYANIEADGVYICKIDENGKERCIGGNICKEYDNLPNEVKDTASWFYKIEVVKILTQEMIDNDPERWRGYRPGWKVNAFNSPEEAIETAKRVAKARFDGDWTIQVDELY